MPKITVEKLPVMIRLYGPNERPHLWHTGCIPEVERELVDEDPKAKIGADGKPEPAFCYKCGEEIEFREV